MINTKLFKQISSKFINRFEIITPKSPLLINIKKTENLEMTSKNFFLNHFNYKMELSENKKYYFYKLDKEKNEIFSFLNFEKKNNLENSDSFENEKNFNLEKKNLYLIKNEDFFEFRIMRKNDFCEKENFLIGEIINFFGRNYLSEIEEKNILILGSNNYYSSFFLKFIVFFFGLNFFYFFWNFCFQTYDFPIIVNKVVLNDFEKFREFHKQN